MGSLNILTIIVVVFPLAWEKTIAGKDTWGYFRDIGPAYWKGINPACGGQRQSPIDIQTKQAQAKQYDPFLVHNYDTANVTLLLRNTDHTAQIDVSGTQQKVTGGGLDGDYITAQLHLHWGNTSSVGSEHTLDGKVFPMELHIVSYKATYTSLTEVLSRGDGLAVLGFFIEIGNTTQKGLDNMVAAFPQIVQAGTNTTMTPFKLEEFLPPNLKNFYRYDGSLTTPRCEEAVIWSVFTDTIKITEEKMAEFRKLQASEKNDNDDYNMYNNFRPAQSLGNRVVYSSSDGNTSAQSNSSSEVNTTAVPSNSSSEVNTTAVPSNSSSEVNTTAVPSNSSSEVNTTAIPFNSSSEVNTTDVPSNFSCEFNEDADQSNSSSEVNSTSVPSNSSSEVNSTSVPSNSSSEVNSTSVPSNSSSEVNSTAVPSNSSSKVNSGPRKCKLISKQNTDQPPRKTEPNAGAHQSNRMALSLFVLLTIINLLITS